MTDQNITTSAAFRARVLAGDPAALELQRIVRGAGYEIGSGAGQIGAVVALEAAYQRGPDAVVQELRARRSSSAPE